MRVPNSSGLFICFLIRIAGFLHGRYVRVHEGLLKLVIALVSGDLEAGARGACRSRPFGGEALPYEAKPEFVGYRKTRKPVIIQPSGVGPSALSGFHMSKKENQINGTA